MKGREEPATVIIAGGGIVGLVLALALKKHVGIIAEVYEKASGFEDDVGGKEKYIYMTYLFVFRVWYLALQASMTNLT